MTLSIHILVKLIISIIIIIFFDGDDSMDFKQLNAFLTISKLQSFTKAAEVLGYAQSSVTTQIKLLESELEVKLFERIGKNVSLGVKIDSREFISDIEIPEPMVPLAYPGHPLINKKSILPKDIEVKPLVLTEMGCFTFHTTRLLILLMFLNQ